MRRTVLLLVTLALSPLGYTAAISAPATPQAAQPAPRVAGQELPALQVSQVVTGLDIPWDVKSVGYGKLLMTERESARLILSVNGQERPVAFSQSRTWVSGETGLMSLAIDPRFASAIN